VGHKEEKSEYFNLECTAVNYSASFNDEIRNTCSKDVDEREINTEVLAGILEIRY
jgi:hypothetical protein